jgi:hypothetical protein
MQKRITSDTSQHALVRPPLCPLAGFLLIEATLQTAPAVPNAAWGTAEGAGTPGASMLPKWAG